MSNGVLILICLAAGFGGINVGFVLGSIWTAYRRDARQIRGEG